MLRTEIRSGGILLFSRTWAWGFQGFRVSLFEHYLLGLGVGDVGALLFSTSFKSFPLAASE